MTSSLLQGRRFYCRDWAFHKVGQYADSRAEAKTCGVLLSGGAGCGKTALCCELVWPTVALGKQAMLNKRLLAYYFCQAHDVETLSVANFVQSVASQLSRSSLLPDYAQQVRAPLAQAALEPSACQQRPDDAFKLAVLDPLARVAPPAHNLIMLVDSLDESQCQSNNSAGGGGAGGGAAQEADGSRTIAELLANHHQHIPPWLLLICSARKQSKTVARMFNGFRKIALDDLRKVHVVRDVQQYILSRLDQEEKLYKHLSRESADMLNHLHIKSNGCFLYLQKVLDGVAENFILLREVQEIPGTLNGLYLWLCQRIFRSAHFDKIRPILNVMLAARRPLTDVELYSCNFTRDSQLTMPDFQKLIDSMSKVLIEGKDGAKILFHHSFAEWLLDVKHCTQRYLCQAAEGHAMIALSFSLHARSLTPLEIQDYALHLVKSQSQSSPSSSPLEPHVLPLWLLHSGASVGDSLTAGVPRDQSVLQLLLDAGAQQPHSAAAGAGALLGADQSQRSKYTEEEALAMILDSGTDINAPDSSGKTMLHNAAHEGNVKALQLLMSRGADAYVTDKSGQTALNMAARQGHAGVVQLLIQVAAPLNLLTVFGMSNNVHVALPTLFSRSKVRVTGSSEY